MTAVFKRLGLTLSYKADQAFVVTLRMHRIIATVVILHYTVIKHFGGEINCIFNLYLYSVKTVSR